MLLNAQEKIEKRKTKLMIPLIEFIIIKLKRNEQLKIQRLYLYVILKLTFLINLSGNYFKLNNTFV